MNMVVLDASSSVLGRFSTQVAKRLMNGEEVFVVNAERAIITGKKDMILKEYKKMREIGSHRKGPFFPRMPDRILKRTIRGMIPYQKPRGREALKRLRVYMGVPKHLENEKLEIIEEAVEKKTCPHAELGDISRLLGAKL